MIDLVFSIVILIVAIFVMFDGGSDMLYVGLILASMISSSIYRVETRLKRIINFLESLKREAR